MVSDRTSGPDAGLLIEGMQGHMTGLSSWVEGRGPKEAQSACCEKYNLCRLRPLMGFSWLYNSLVRRGGAQADHRTS